MSDVIGFGAQFSDFLLFFGQVFSLLITQQVLDLLVANYQFYSY